MQVSVENTGNLGRKLKVSVPDATVSAHYKDKMSKLAKDAHLKGFRKGKVPPTVLQQKFGSQVRIEVVQDLIQESISNAVKEHNLNIAGMPSIDSLQNKTGEDLEFTAVFEVYPQITLSDLAALEIERKVCDIEKADIDKMITKMKDELADWDRVERACQKGDKITVDFARIVKDGTREEQKNVQMILGNEGVLPGLTEALVGKAIATEVKTELTYPKDWADEKVAGEPVTLWITIHEVFAKQPLDDAALAKKLDVTVDQLADKIKERMNQELTTVLKDDLRETVLEKILEKNPIDVPQALIAQEKEAIFREQQRQNRAMNKEMLETEEVDSAARKRVELGLLLNEVIKHFDIKSDGKRIRQEIERIAAQFPNPETVVDVYYKNQNLLASIERVVLLDSAVEAIVGRAKMLDKKISFDELMSPSA